MIRQAETASLNTRSDALAAFDYAAPAEVFMGTGTFGRGRMTYRRFASAALAIRFAIEELPAQLRGRAVMEFLEARFDHRAMRQLYEGHSYPLMRR